MTNRAVYPGTFDPVTNGHIDLIKRARHIFAEVVVAVAANPGKTPLFSVKERVGFLKEATRDMSGVRVEPFDTLAVEYIKQVDASVMIRGLRMVSDFEYEFQLALTNRKLAGSVETIFMMPSEAYTYISARLIKEGAVLGADVTPWVPSFVAAALRRKLRARKGARRR